MSVQSPIYILWGVMLPYPKGKTDTEQFEKAIDEYNDNAFKRESVNRTNGVTVLLDGMGGKYMAVGHVLARSGPYGDDLGTHSIPHVRTLEEAEKFTQWAKGVEACLSDLGLGDHTGEPLGWHIIQHYR